MTIWWCHQLVAHPSETVRLPWHFHERGTVYRQLSAQPPHRLLPSKKNLNHFCLDCHSVCDNVYRSLTMFSALAAVCTVWLRYRNCLSYISLHYMWDDESLTMTVSVSSWRSVSRSSSWERRAWDILIRSSLLLVTWLSCRLPLSSQLLHSAILVQKSF